MIDHIYVSNEENVSRASVSKIGISDHCAVFCNRKINSCFKKKSHKSITYRSFKHFNENDFLNDLMLVDWSVLESIDYVDTMLETWYSLFMDTVNTHAPLKSHGIKKDTKLTGLQVIF